MVDYTTHTTIYIKLCGGIKIFYILHYNIYNFKILPKKFFYKIAIDNNNFL